MVKTSSNSVLYIDPFSGVSGDMLLGAFISLGVPLEVISAAVEAVIPGEVKLSGVPVSRSGLAGVMCEVKIIGGPARRTLDEMVDLVKGSRLPGSLIGSILRVLGSLGEAEGKAHGNPGAAVHLHELGGQDTLADIAGALAALSYLAPGKVRCGPVNLGRGFVQTSHGLMPVPAPATAHLVEGMTVFADGPETELTTPTGAALLSEIVEEFAPIGPMTVVHTGCGAGSRDFEGFPNLLRLFQGSSEQDDAPGAVIIECGIDDVSPEYLAPVTDALQSAGAREVHVIPAFTKKSRMGVLLRVLAPESHKETLIDAVLENSGSAGLRFWKVSRTVLEREMITVKTPHGPVSFKRWQSPSGQWRYKPEFEDVQQLADRTGIPAATIRDIAVASYVSEVGDGQEED